MRCSRVRSVWIGFAVVGLVLGAIIWWAVQRGRISGDPVAAIGFAVRQAPPTAPAFPVWKEVAAPQPPRAEPDYLEPLPLPADAAPIQKNQPPGAPLSLAEAINTHTDRGFGSHGVHQVAAMREEFVASRQPRSGQPVLSADMPSHPSRSGYATWSAAPAPVNAVADASGSVSGTDESPGEQEAGGDGGAAGLVEGGLLDPIAEGDEDKAGIGSETSAGIGDWPSGVYSGFPSTADLLVQSRYGSPEPATGSHRYLSGDGVTARAWFSVHPSGQWQYTCSGWRGSGSVPDSGEGTYLQFTITEDSELTWLWETNAWCEFAVAGDGAGQISRAGGWVPVGSTITVTAAPDDGSRFVRWSGSLESDSPSISYRVTQPGTFTAEFALMDGAGGEGDEDDTNSIDTVHYQPSTLATDTTWTASSVWYLDKPVHVAAGVTLTIEPGAVVRSQPEGALVVLPVGRLHAVGAPDAPIVMTDMWDDSACGTNGVTEGSPYAAPNNGMSRHWGGLVILGRAPVSTASATSPGLARLGLSYGGQDDQDDSGSLQFVSIRYGGRGPDGVGLLAGLTLAGVGDETLLSNVEVFQCAGDGIEFDGGTIDAKYMQVIVPGGHAFVCRQGYRGRGQFWFAVQGALQEIGEVSGLGCLLESDADLEGTITCPLVYNATFVGLGGSSNATDNSCFGFAGTSGGRFQNSIVMDFGGAVALVKGSATDPAYDAADNLLISDWGAQFHRHVMWTDRLLQLSHNMFWNCCLPNYVFVPNDSGGVTLWDPESSVVSNSAVAISLLQVRCANASVAADVEPRSPVLVRERAAAESVAGRELRPLVYMDPRIRDVRGINARCQTPVDAFFSPVSFQGAFHEKNWAAWTLAARLGMLPVENYGDYDLDASQVFMSIEVSAQEGLSLEFDPGIFVGRMIEVHIGYRHPETDAWHYYEMGSGAWLERPRAYGMIAAPFELNDILRLADLPAGAELLFIVDCIPNLSVDGPEARLGWVGYRR